MAITHLDDALIDGYLEAVQRDPALLAHVRGCDACLGRVRAARRDRLLVRSALERERVDRAHVDPATVAAFCDERLDDATTGATAAHLARCDDCFARYLDLIDVLLAVATAADREQELAAATRATPVVATPGTFGTVFVTRFADTIELTFVAAPGAAPPTAVRRSERASGTAFFDPARPDRVTAARARRYAPRAARAELRSRSFTDVMRGLQTRYREPGSGPPRPSVRVELPDAIATIELVDLHDGEVELNVRVLPVRQRPLAMRLTVSRPGERDETVSLTAARPTPLAPLRSATLTFAEESGAPVHLGIRNLVIRAPTT